MAWYYREKILKTPPNILDLFEKLKKIEGYKLT